MSKIVLLFIGTKWNYEKYFAGEDYNNAKTNPKPWSLERCTEMHRKI